MKAARHRPQGRACAAARRTARGFSLLELNIALAIVAILGALALPAYQDQVERARLSQMLLQIDAVRSKAQTLLAERGMDLCRWPLSGPNKPSPPEFATLEQLVREALHAVDPAGVHWPLNANGLVPGNPGRGPNIQLTGRGRNVHRAQLLLQELTRAGLVEHGINRPTLVAMTVRLGERCP